MGEWITVRNKKAKKEGEPVVRREREFFNSRKKIMCNNIITYGRCTYDTKCTYAHSFDEQNVDSMRRTAYDIVMHKVNSSDVKITNGIYNVLLQFTKVCEMCAKNKCAGGLNCKFGVFDKRYQVCIDDLRDGLCVNTICNKIHLTNHGYMSLREFRDEGGSHRENENENEIETEMGTHNEEKETIVIIRDADAKTFIDDRCQLDIDSSSDDDQYIKRYLEEKSDSDNECSKSIFE